METSPTMDEDRSKEAELDAKDSYMSHSNTGNKRMRDKCHKNKKATEEADDEGVEMIAVIFCRSQKSKGSGK